MSAGVCVEETDNPELRTFDSAWAVQHFGPISVLIPAIHSCCLTRLGLGPRPDSTVTLCKKKCVCERASARIVCSYCCERSALPWITP